MAFSRQQTKIAGESQTSCIDGRCRWRRRMRYRLVGVDGVVMQVHGRTEPTLPTSHRTAFSPAQLSVVTRCTVLLAQMPNHGLPELPRARPCSISLSNVHGNSGSDATAIPATLSELLSSPHQCPVRSPAAPLPRNLEYLRPRHHRACRPASLASARWEGH